MYAFLFYLLFYVILVTQNTITDAITDVEAQNSINTSAKELSLNTKFDRKDSVLSTDSRESIVSVTSIRAENRVRRFFNY